MEWLAAREPAETVIDGGVARCWPFEQDDMILLESDARPAKDMSANWIATDRALHFLRYNIGQARTWEWASVQSAELIRKGLLFCDVAVHLADGNVLVFQGSRRGARALLAAVTEHAGAPR
jgi:hypothetical protein